MGIEKGNKIKIEYTGTLDDGTEFDSTEKHGQPLEFTLGEQRLISGFENALEGMEIDEEKTVRIESADAYGDINAELVQKIPKSELPEGNTFEIGMMLGMQLADGQQIPATITGIDDEFLTLDLNHPLAGKALTFKLKVVEIAKVPVSDE